MYDLIGDVHGHADELEQLLEKLGYRESGGVHRHARRKALFLGDYIDRGPKIARVLQIVRAMVDDNAALAIAGNHELNALAFHLHDPSRPGTMLRPRSNRNIRQHAQTLLQLGDDELASWLAWFRTLPFWLDLDGLRAVHACWDEPSIHSVRQGLNHFGGVSDDFLAAACSKSGSLYGPIEVLLKGPETPLPDGFRFHDKDGAVRSKIRTRWYREAQAQSYRDLAFQADPVECDLTVDAEVVAAGYPADAKPVFFGHYWLRAEAPAPLAANVACLDYSVAKGGMLCAYRWQCESVLQEAHYVCVNAGDSG